MRNIRFFLKMIVGVCVGLLAVVLMFSRVGRLADPQLETVLDICVRYGGWAVAVILVLVWALDHDSGDEDRKNEQAREQAKDDVMLSSIGEGVLATDKEGVVTVFNKTCEHMLGWTSTDAIGKKLVDVVQMIDDRGHEISAADRPLAQTLAQGITSSFVQNYRRKDGTTFPVSITVSPILHEGDIDGAIAVVRDVTKEKEIDRAKTEFVSLASHQLRTPLSIINWYVETLLAGDHRGWTPDQVTYLKQVYESAGRMAELVDSLLNISRLEMGTMAMRVEEIDVVRLAQEVVTELDPDIRKYHHTLAMQVQDPVPHVLFDRRFIWIIVLNLLTNAIKYTPEHGTITVKLFGEEGFVCLNVSDTGVGIPDDQREMIFSKMFRAENAKMIDSQGSGLGLYMVKSIVDRAGGTISFSSSVGKGTTFYVRLPI
jgi:PAS domain S-box-containing protein